MSDPTIERPLTIGDLLDDASLWPNSATIVRVERCLDNGRLLVREQVRDTPIGHAPRIVGPTLQRFVATVTVERLRRIPQLGPKAIRALAEALSSKGYRLRDREEPPEEVPISRDALLARVADIIRKSRVGDAEKLVTALERRILPDAVLYKPGLIVLGIARQRIEPGDMVSSESLVDSGRIGPAAPFTREDFAFTREDIENGLGLPRGVLDRMAPGGVVDGPLAEDEIRVVFDGPQSVRLEGPNGTISIDPNSIGIVLDDAPAGQNAEAVFARCESRSGDRTRRCLLPLGHAGSHRGPPEPGRHGQVASRWIDE